MEGEYYMEHGSVAHRGEDLNIFSVKLVLIFLQIFSLISFYYFGSKEKITVLEHFTTGPPTKKMNCE